MARTIIKAAVLLTALILALSGCGPRERALIEIDFADAAEWRYLFGVDIYGEPFGTDSGRNFAGSLRAYLCGLPSEAGGTLRAGLEDVIFIATFLPEEERGEIERRLSALQVTASEEGIVLSDTAGMPGVLSGAWDILRSPARVIPALPNTEMTVGSSWEREQRFPITIPQGEADGLLYQLYTLDSLFKTPMGVPVATISWVFTYRVAMLEEGASAGQRKHPLAGSGRGTALLDLSRKKLLKSNATFQVTHSGITGMDINEIVHFEMME